MSNKQHPSRRGLWSLLAVVSALLAVLAATAWAAGLHEVRFGVVTAGGGTSTQGNQALVGVIGQPVVGFSTGGALTLRSGHFQGMKGQVSAVPGGGSNVPSVNTLHDPYPNPFNPLTNVSFDLATAGDVRVRIFNSRGQQVRDLVQGSWPAGRHLVKRCFLEWRILCKEVTNTRQGVMLQSATARAGGRLPPPLPFIAFLT